MSVNTEQPVGRKARYTSASALHTKYEAAKTANDENRQIWLNIVRSYERTPIKRSNGKYDADFGEFRFKCDQKIDTYVDIITERTEAAQITTLFGTDTERQEWSREITDAFNEFCINIWEDRFEESYKDIFDMVLFSKGVEHWETQFGCYSENIPIENIFPDADAPMNPKKWNILFVRKKYSFVDLYNEIEDADIAERKGWDVARVKKFLREENGTNQSDEDADEFEEFRRGNADDTDDSPGVTVVFAYVKEYSKNGSKKITKYAFPEFGSIPSTSKSNLTDDNKKEAIDRRGFFVVAEEYCECFSQVVAIRTENLTSGYHQCPSFARLIYIATKFQNQALNKIIRAAMRNVNIFLKSENKEQQQKISQLTDEEVQILDPDTEVVQQSINHNWMGLVEIMREVQFQMATGTKASVSTGSQNVKGKAITAKEAEINAMSVNAAISSDHKIFASQDQRHLKETYRRFVDKDRMFEGCDGYKGHVLFINKMKSLGIPDEAFDPENVVVKSVMPPAPAFKVESARILIEGINRYINAKSDGEKRAAKDLIAAAVGRQNVDFYVGDDQKLRITEIFKIGRENTSLDDPDFNPNNVKINPVEDIHPLHIAMHLDDSIYKLKKAEEYLFAVESNQVLPEDAGIYLRKAEEILIAQDNKSAHAMAHIMVIEQSASERAEVGEAKVFRDQLVKIQEKEKTLETRLLNLKETRQSQLTENRGFTLEERHKARMYELDEAHLEAMNSIKLGSAIEKHQVGKETTQATHAAKIRQKEEDHVQKMVQESQKAANDLAVKKAETQIKQQGKQDDRK